MNLTCWPIASKLAQLTMQTIGMVWCSSTSSSLVREVIATQDRADMKVFGKSPRIGLFTNYELTLLDGSALNSMCILLEKYLTS